MPTTITQDTFTGAVANLVGGHTADTGGGWGYAGATWGSSTNQLRLTGSGGVKPADGIDDGGAMHEDLMPLADCWVEVDFSVTGSDSGSYIILVLRSQSTVTAGAANQRGLRYIDAEYRPDTGYADVGGNGATFTTAAGPIASAGSHTLRMECEGSAVRLKLDGATIVTSTAKVTDLVAGRAGIETRINSPTVITEYRAGTLATYIAPADFFDAEVGTTETVEP